MSVLPRRWRAYLGLLRAAGGRRAVLFAGVALLAGLLPTAAIVASGALVAAVPGVVENGLGGAGRSALVALGAFVLALVLLAAATNALTYLSRALDAAFALEVHDAVAAVTLGTPGLAPLEDPALADELQAIRDAERRDVLRWPVSSLADVATARLRGVAACAILLGFAWWAPLLLAAAWHLTSRVYRRATEHGVSIDMSDGAVRIRRAEYLRSLAVDAPAAKEVRVFGLGPWLVSRYGDAWREAIRVMWRSRSSHRGAAVAAALALAVSHAAVLAALAAGTGRGTVTVAALVIFVQAVIATSDLGMIGDWQWYLVRALAVSRRVADVRAHAPRTPPAARADGRSPPPRGPLAVRLDDVRFTYRGRDGATLDGLTLHVPAGQSLAIVGENGAGKSTLIKLLCGLYQPDAGRVAVGGRAPLEARGRIAVIFQDFVRYRLPLRDNVAFGHLPLARDDAALEEALRDAGGAALPRALPGGWETVLSREFADGAELSGGQWQRVALARALAAVRGGAGLLILDEPTASLDVRAETELFERFLDVTRGVTTILVSHRLSSVRRADRIVVVHGGRVVEDGTHDALVADGGRYARMFALQAERFSAAGAAPGAPGGEVEHA